jgi:hypothetical protein
MKNPSDSALMKTRSVLRSTPTRRGGIAGFPRTQARQVFESSGFDVGPLTGPRLAS